ncbi:NUMOD4 domain-containing protein [Hymenobacter koreensis]|uniref:HNH endonuclease n=1 Tax=Hymenobacter koreensis TaxID=1084523 RepID=A0ABP8JK72_9BACT
MEIFMPIAEVQGRYEVSNLGHVYKVAEIIIRSNGRPQSLRRKLLTPVFGKSGYLKVRLRVTAGVVKNLTVHSLVAKYFAAGWQKGLQVNHIDGVKTNNCASNLEWVTPKGNIQHAHAIGLASNKRFNKPVLADDTLYPSITACATAYNVHPASISNWCKDKSRPRFTCA